MKIQYFTRTLKLIYVNIPIMKKCNILDFIKIRALDYYLIFSP